uniref:Slc2a-7 n=1 Tax=Schmidtea mediterranea TaxID=79327 RepID=A0A0H3YIR2_SCHMD|nr:slc2a-7 [Schmidtea mediterranea]
MEIVDSAENLVDSGNMITWRLCFSSFVASIGMIQFGWNTGVINNPQTSIKLFINETLVNRGSFVSDSKIKILLATVVAIFAAGGLVGALIAGWLSNRFGRRNGILANTLVMFVSGVFMLFAPYARSFEMIIIGRLLTGIGSGIYTGIVPVYLNEIAPLKVRGAFGIMSQLGVVIGIFLSEILGLTAVMGNEKYWNILLGLIIIPAILQALFLHFCPSSPKYLLFFKNDERAAEKALRKLRPLSFDIESEMEQMKKDSEHSRHIEKVGIRSMITNRHLLMSLTVGIVLHLSQQFSGINNIFYYSSTLFESVGVSKQNSEFSTLGVGGIMILVTLISIPLIERVGRRVLHIGGLCGCLLTCVCFTIFYSFHSQISSFNYLSVISALLFVASFGIGPGSIPWMMIPEMFAEGSRSTAASVGVSVNWLSNLVVGLIFPSLHDALQNLIFIPFIVCQVLSILFLWFKMPETKGLKISETVGFLKDQEEGIISGGNLDKNSQF